MAHVEGKSQPWQDVFYFGFEAQWQVLSKKIKIEPFRWGSTFACIVVPL